MTKEIKCYTCFRGFSLGSRLCIFVVHEVRVKYGTDDGRVVKFFFLNEKNVKKKMNKIVLENDFFCIFVN